jgi:hypothetical protein
MYMRRASRGLDVRILADDLSQDRLCLDALSDLPVGAVRSWWRHDHPEYGWIALAIIVAAADVTGSRTMSDAFRTASRSKIGRPVIIAGWAVLTAHLFGLVPPERDPINQLWRKCSGR